MKKDKKEKKTKAPNIKIIIVFLLVIVAIIGAFIVKGKKPNASKFDEFTDIDYGIYIGTPKEGDTFVPQLTLNDDKTFQFRVAKTYTYNGQYHIAHNRVILTITEEKSYTFGKQGENLVLIENVEKYLDEGTQFKLWGTLTEQKEVPVENTEK